MEAAQLAELLDELALGEVDLRDAEWRLKVDGAQSGPDAWLRDVLLPDLRDHGFLAGRYPSFGEALLLELIGEAVRTGQLALVESHFEAALDCPEDGLSPQLRQMPAYASLAKDSGTTRARRVKLLRRVLDAYSDGMPYEDRVVLHNLIPNGSADTEFDAEARQLFADIARRTNILLPWRRPLANEARNLLSRIDERYPELSRQDLVVRTPGRILELVEEVHDLWFDLDAIERDKDSATLTLILYDDSRRSPVSRLGIHGVADVRITDTERVGWYDINEIKYSSPVLTITTCIPVQFVVEVRTLDLRLSHADDAAAPVTEES